MKSNNSSCPLPYPHGNSTLFMELQSVPFGDDATGVGPWLDELLPPTAQLLLRSVELQIDELDEEELRHVLMATWRGWLVEREVVRQHLEAMDIQLEVAYPEGFLPFDVLLNDGLIDTAECEEEESDADR